MKTEPGKDFYNRLKSRLNEDKMTENLDNDICNGVKLAVKYGWGLSNFKEFISQFLLIENDEDQWTFDFESWVLTLKPGRYEHPCNWAEEYYSERWDTKSMNESLESLKRIATKNKQTNK